MGLNYREMGLKVGYFKPLGIKVLGFRGAMVDEDAEQAKAAFGLKESLEEITPVMISPELYLRMLSGKGKLSGRVSKSFAKVSKGKDIVLIDGVGDFRAGRLLDLSDVDTAVMLKSKIILISLYDSIYVLDEILSTVDVIRRYEKKSGRRILAGIVFNNVPSSGMDELKSTVIPFLKKKGIEVLGAIPRDKILRSVRVKDIVEEVSGEVLTAKERGGTAIESFLVGAMSPTHAIKYFRRRSNVAVITGGDRSDMQLAALEARVNCLILTGSLMPSAPILARADELKIPLVLVKDDTISAVEKMEALLRRLQVKGDVKINAIKSLIKDNLDLERLDEVM